MRSRSLLSWIGLVLSILVCACSEGEPVARPPVVGREAWFLDQLKSLADADDLSDPIKVGAILKISFAKSVQTTSPSHMEAFAKTFERDEYTPTARTWFVAGPPGYASTGNFKPDGHSNGFSAGRDPVARGNSVNFKYFESKRFGLAGQSNMAFFDSTTDDNQTSVIFYGIEKLTCMTFADVRAVFPGLFHMGATDASAERYIYYAPRREDAGTVLSFAAPDGRCITEASVEQFSQFGNRYARARYNYVGCLEETAKSFCSQHGDGSPQSAASYDGLNAAMRSRCGTFEPYFESEPRTNLKAPSDREQDEPPTGCPYPRLSARTLPADPPTR